MSDVFVSYAAADRRHAERVAEILREQGWSVWWDRELLAGATYDETIEAALGAARCVVVLWSGESVGSRWVRAEAGEGAARGILVPVLLQAVAVPLEFRRIQVVDLSRFDPPNVAMFVRSVQRLLAPGTPPRGVSQSLTTNGVRRSRVALSAALFVSGALAALLISSATGRWRSPASDAPQANSPERTPNVSETPAASHQERKTDRPRINLLARETGGRLISSPHQVWESTIDGSEEAVSIGIGGDRIRLDAVYGFKDGQPRTFDTFALFIPAAGDNVREFELLVSDDLAPASFRSIGVFETKNMRVTDALYQRFSFAPVTARYLKFRLLSSYSGGYTAFTEFQLWESAGQR